MVDSGFHSSPELAVIHANEFGGTARASLLVWGVWMVMVAIAVVAVPFHFPHGPSRAYLNIVLLAGAVVALTVAVRRVRHYTRSADAFFSLVLLNPLLYTRHADLFNNTLLGTAMLGLMAGAIIAMSAIIFCGTLR